MLKANTAASENVSAGRDRGPAAFVRRRGLVSFYALAFGLSWLAWLPYILSQYGLGVVQISLPGFLGSGEIATQLAGILIGAYIGPLGAAFVVTALSEGRPGIRRWTGRLFRWGVNWKWYALALLGVPAIITLGTLTLPGAAAGLSFPPLEAFLLYVPLLLMQVVTTGLAEEPGWRDFALVRHQRQQGPLLGTLVLGVLWAAWHFPLLLTDWGAGIGGANLRTLLIFTAFCVALSLVLTWLFNRTRESLPLAILAHVSNNNFASVMFASVFTTVSVAQNGLLGGLIGFGAVALVLVVATRGRLGYGGPYDDQPEEGAGKEEPGGVPVGHAVAGWRADHPEAREA